MPCNCDHLEANDLEKEGSKVACLLEELFKGRKINKSHFDGYHPDIYAQGTTRGKVSTLTATLCNLLRKEKDVTKFSLELQVWWRDHQKADREKYRREFRAKRQAKQKEAALKKLTPAERRVLGLD